MPGLLGRTATISSGFVPSGSPVGWWKADAITGLEDGDPVGTWPDSSGNGNDLTQSIASKKPTYYVNVKNGLPGVKGDAAIYPGYMVCTVSLTQPKSIFVVARSGGIISSGGYRKYVSGFTVGAYGSGGNKNLLYLLDDSLLWNTDTALPNDHMFYGLANGANSEIRYNGSTVVTGNAGTAGNDFTELWWNIVGASMYIFECILYDNNESPSDNESGLNDKWAVY